MEDNDKRVVSLSMLAMNIRLLDALTDGSESAKVVRDATLNGMMMAVGADIFREALDLAGASGPLPSLGH